MMKFALILAVLGFPVGVTAYAAIASQRCPEHCPTCHSQCQRHFDHDGPNTCPHGHTF